MGPTGSLQALLASNGALLLTGSTPSTVKHYGIVIRANTTIAAWTATDDGVERDLLAYFGISGAALTSGDIALIIPAGWRSSSITLDASGQVWLLRE